MCGQSAVTSVDVTLLHCLYLSVYLSICLSVCLYSALSCRLCSYRRRRHFMHSSRPGGGWRGHSAVVCGAGGGVGVSGGGGAINRGGLERWTAGI